MVRFLANVLLILAIGESCTRHPNQLPTASPDTPGVFKREVSSQFSRFASCPLDRVELNESEGPAPPPEVASDPQRLAVWTDVHGGDIRYYDVVGCEHHVTYACKMGWRNTCHIASATTEGP
jgi:hypothetical protein